MRSRWLYVLAGLLLLVGAWWLTGAATGEENGDWIEVTRDDLVLGVEVTGKLHAVETTQLGPPQVKRLWEFKISYMAPEGQEVEEGTPVLGFDTTELVRRLERQQAERDGAISAGRERGRPRPRARANLRSVHRGRVRNDGRRLGCGRDGYGRRRGRIGHEVDWTGCDRRRL